MQVKGRLNIAELVTVTATRMPGSGHYNIDITPLDKRKRVVMDPSAMKVMGEKVADKCKEMSVKDPRTVKYLEEFVSRMLPELDRVGLVLLEDIPEAPEDPYKFVRNQFRRR